MSPKSADSVRSKGRKMEKRRGNLAEISIVEAMNRARPLKGLKKKSPGGGRDDEGGGGQERHQEETSCQKHKFRAISGSAGI